METIRKTLRRSIRKKLPATLFEAAAKSKDPEGPFLKNKEGTRPVNPARRYEKFKVNHEKDSFTWEISPVAIACLVAIKNGIGSTFRITKLYEVQYQQSEVFASMKQLRKKRLLKGAKMVKTRKEYQLTVAGKETLQMAFTEEFAHHCQAWVEYKKDDYL